MINSACELTDEEKADVSRLASVCALADGFGAPLWLSNELNYKRDDHCFYTIRDGSGTAAFLTLFMPTRSEAEVTAFTRPDRRREGLFSQLLAMARADCAAYGIPELLFCVRPESRSGLAVLAALPGAGLSHSELRMILRPDGRVPAPRTDARLTFSDLSRENLDDYRVLITADSDDGDEDGGPGSGDSYIDASLNDPARRAVIAYIGGVPVGRYHLTTEDGCAFIYGLGLLREYRGRGYGGEMTERAVRDSLASGRPAMLDVDTGNPAALHIYRKLGFETVSRMDYYRQKV